MSDLKTISIQILYDAKQEMHERYVKTNEAQYSVLKMLIDFEIQRQDFRVPATIITQPKYKACKGRHCTMQAPQVGDYCGKYRKDIKTKRDFKKKWSVG